MEPNKDAGILEKLVKLSCCQNNLNQWFTHVKKPLKVFQIVFANISKSFQVMRQSAKRLSKGKPASARIRGHPAQKSTEQIPTLSAGGNASRLHPKSPPIICLPFITETGHSQTEEETNPDNSMELTVFYITDQNENWRHFLPRNVSRSLSSMDGPKLSMRSKSEKDPLSQ